MGLVGLAAAVHLHATAGDRWGWGPGLGLRGIEAGPGGWGAADPALSRRMLQTLYNCFWWDRLWLPANLTWADLEDRDGRVYAKAADLYIILPLAFLFLLVRHLFEM